MKTKLEKIVENNIVHNTLLDRRSIEKCVDESYNLGVRDVLDWLSKMDHLCNNIQYIIEEWHNQNKK
ncbi:MAG: hypothetical protein ACK42H_17405 [Planctomycetota bacterium]